MNDADVFKHHRRQRPVLNRRIERQEHGNVPGRILSKPMKLS